MLRFRPCNFCWYPFACRVPINCDRLIPGERRPETHEGINRAGWNPALTGVGSGWIERSKSMVWSDAISSLWVVAQLYCAGDHPRCAINCATTHREEIAGPVIEA